MKKFVSVFLTAAMAAASLTGCQSGGSSDALTPVTLNEVAHSIFYAPQYAAIELGYFKDEGIDLTLVNGAGADKVMTALIFRRCRHRFHGFGSQHLCVSGRLRRLRRKLRPAHSAGRQLPRRKNCPGKLLLAGFEG